MSHLYIIYVDGLSPAQKTLIQFLDWETVG